MEYHEMLTENFMYGEFWSNSLNRVKVEPPEIAFENIQMVAEELQKVRDEIGRPIRITSGYRTPEWNKAIGGASKSKHLSGLASDIKVHIPNSQLLVYLGRYTTFKGFGISSSFIHCDFRKKLTFWYY